MLPPNKTLRTFALYLTCVSTFSWAADNAPTVQPPYPDGHLELYKGDHIKCTIDFKSGIYPLNVDGPCSDATWDDVDRFRLLNVPSASTFTLYDSESCSPIPPQAFIFTFKVVKNPTTMPQPITIERAGSTAVGSLVEGITLRMEEKVSNRPARDLLGCVKIIRSAVPEN